MKTRILATLFILISINIKAQEKNFEWNKHAPTFANGLSNQVAYINFGSNRVWGWVEVTLTSGYSYQLATGKYTKRFSIGRNVGTGAYFYQESEVPTAFGPVANQWKLGEFQINSNGDLVLPIYHLVSKGNTLLVNIKGSSTIAVNTNLISIINPTTIENTEIKDKICFKNDLTLQGNVGIGTANTFGYKLAVNGTIGSTEVKVENTSSWPDFVFDNDYELPTLEEVEQHIAENGHLPEIPGEAEVAENGINLGEMNAKLLQKIEELTLYMIEQNKQNQAQQKELEAQSALIEQLKNEVSALKSE